MTYLPVAGNGLIDLGALEAALSDRTALVSIMAVNNEIGVIQPIAEIGALCRRTARASTPTRPRRRARSRSTSTRMNIDLMSITGHKIYGPKGIGVLYVRRKPRVPIEPLIDGGGQERGLRSGTVPAPLAVGLGEACAIAAGGDGGRGRAADRAARPLPRAPHGRRCRTCTLHGDPAHRIPGNLNLSFPDIEGQDLMMRPDRAFGLDRLGLQLGRRSGRRMC